jgi:hypothetical protein
MGVATALIGFVPSYQSMGLAAAFILFAVRVIQGLCLAREYGGVITYIAGHIEEVASAPATYFSADGALYDALRAQGGAG